MARYAHTHIHSAADLRRVAIDSGGHFFDASTMKFFSSRLLEGIHAPDGHEAVTGNRFFFVTSEKYDDNPRHYSVRVMTLKAVRDDRPDVDISTVGGPYSTAREARGAALVESNTLRYLAG